MREPARRRLRQNTVDRRSLLLGLAGLPMLTACGLELTRTTLRPDGDIHPADPASLRQGGMLRWAEEEFAKDYNANTLNYTAAVHDFASALMPTAYSSDAHANLALRAEYYTDITMTSHDPQILRYTINPKAHWSDGTPITWEDLYAQWKAQNGTNPDYQVGTTTGYRDIADIQPGVDERQAVVTFNRHYADWKSLFSYLYPKSTNLAPEAFNKGWILGPGGFGREPVTAGPFKIASYDIGQQRLTLVADPSWWGRKPRLDSIIFMGLAPDAQIGALQNGEIDFMDLASNAPNLAMAESIRGVDIRSGPGQYLTNLTFCGKPGRILADLGLRRAVAKGVDRQKIASTIIGSVTTSAAPAYNLVFLQGLVGYEEHKDILPYDLQAANAELDQIGWVRHGQFRVKDGQKLLIHLVIPAQTASSANAAKVLQQMLAEIGVDLVIDAVSATSFLSDYVIQGNFDIALFSWGHTPYPTDIGSIYGLYKNPDGSPDPQQNSGQIGSDAINDLIAKMQGELDEEKMRRIGNELDIAIAEIAHSIPLYLRPNSWGVRSNLRNFGPVGIGDVDYTAIGFTR